MTAQTMAIAAGAVLLLSLVAMALILILRPRGDMDNDPGCFVWMVALVVFLAAASLFTYAGVK